MNSTLTAVAAPDPFDDLRVLFDADAAVSSELVARRRSLALLSDLEAAFAVDLEDEARDSIYRAYVAAFNAANFDAMADLYFEAADMDASRPGFPKLITRLDEVSSTRIARVA